MQKKVVLKKSIKYALLPGVLPRLRELFGSGFSNLAYLMAFIYGGLKLLPANHAYLDRNNLGRFGIVNVLTEAGKNIEFKWKNIDQIAIYVALLAGMVILALQFVLILFSLVTGMAAAQATSCAGYSGTIFTTDCPEFDVAFTLLDYVFGVPGMFESQVELSSTTFPFPVHVALHALLAYYSWMMFFIALMIFLYFVVVVVGETAQTGIPFGKRFNHAWAPLRLVIALGLLLPVANGLNTGQYIVLGTAKAGSSVATNGWYAFNEKITGSGAANPSPLCEAPDRAGIGSNCGENIIAVPNYPEIAPLVAYMALVRTCAYAYQRQYGENEGGFTPYIKAWLVRTGTPAQELTSFDGGTAPSYEEALDMFGKGDIIVRFGHKPEEDDAHYEKAQNEPGGVLNYCGEIVFPVSTPVPVDAANPESEAGPYGLQRMMFRYVAYRFHRATDIDAFAARMGELFASDGASRTCAVTDADLTGAPGFSMWSMFTSPPTGAGGDCEQPTAQQKSMLLTKEQTWYEDTIDRARLEYIRTADFSITAEQLQRGWAAAGTYYNVIANTNGKFFEAVINMPAPASYPELMSYVVSEKRKSSSYESGVDTFEPTLPDTQMTFHDTRDKYIALTLSGVYKFWMQEGLSTDPYSNMLPTGNAFWDAMQWLFGSYGLFDLRKNEEIFIHPMAQLSGLGKGLVESTLNNLVIAFGFSTGGGFLGSQEQIAGAVAESLSGFFLSVAMIGLTAGFILYYILPFFPFLYFFFAVGTWIKSIFEAMVGVPLWALAHMRIDGNGLPGDAAANGYFLILEIFVRPILTVFGLIASMAIFAAFARILNEIFDVVTQNVGGYDEDAVIGLVFKRSIVDEFFYTVLYAFILYMTATSSFKLIDQIPNHILRWAGSGAKSFGDQYDDPTSGLTRYAAMGGYTIGQRLSGAVVNAGQGLGAGVGGVAKMGESMHSPGAAGGRRERGPGPEE